VNIASRAQSAAAAGEILVSQGVYERVQSELANSKAQEYKMKGIQEPILLYAV
jgi:adenylate cyclase